MRLFLLLLFFIPFTLQARYSPEKFLEKVNSPPPEWMMFQIKQDLSAFAENGISKQMIQDTLKNVYTIPNAYKKANLVHLGIKDNVAFCHTGNNHYRTEGTIKFLNDMAQWVTLPDVNFLFCLWDFYDNPTILEQSSVPVFAICKYRDNRVAVAVPEVIYMSNRIDNSTLIRTNRNWYKWEKRIDIPFWRGATTDLPYTETTWDCRPRGRLVFFSKEHPDIVDAMYSHPAWLSEEMLDHLKELEIIGDWRGAGAWVQYRYLLAVDGVSFPSAFQWELVSGSTVLKQDSEFIEWFYQALTPYVHYIPYKEDCSDLAEKVQWLRSHQEEAQQIAQNAYDFYVDNLENEDLMLYYYLLLHEYAKLQRD